MQKLYGKVAIELWHLGISSTYHKKLDLEIGRYPVEDSGKFQFGCKWNTCFGGFLLENYWE